MRQPRTSHPSRPRSIVVQVAVAILVGGAGSACADGPADAADSQLVRQFVTEAERLVRERDRFQGAPSVAAVLAELGDAEPAVAILELVRGRKGLHFDVALRQLAAGHARHGDLAAARRAIAGIRDVEDGSARQRPLAWIEVGEALAARGDREDARQAFDEAFAEAVAEIESGKVYSSKIDLLGRIGLGRWANGDEDASARAFAKALEYAPQAGSLAGVCQRKIAAHQAQIGKLAVARDTLGKITDPSDRDQARQHVAKTLFAAGQRDEAQRLVEEITTPRAARYSALEFADWLVRAGEPEAAKPWIARAERAWTDLKDREERIGLAFRLCSARAATGERDSAREWLERAAAQAAEQSDEELGRGAPKMLEPMRRDGLREATLREIAALQSQLGLVAEARRSFSKALAAARGRAGEIWRKVAIWAVVKSQAKAGLPDDALELMMSLPREDRDWPILAQIGCSLAQAGRLPEAIALCDRYQGHQALAETLLEMGKAETALAVALRQKGGSGIYPLEKIARTLAAKGREQVVVDALRGEMDDNQRLVIIEGTMEGLLERSRDRRRP
jgi:tetratricopeptide (TPR) repeat protein